jgi:hypothetical protein
MRWSAETNFAEVGKGTSFLLIENGYVVGAPPATLTAGTEFNIRNSRGEPSAAKIVQAGEREIVIETADGSRWRMTPRQPDEMPVGITWNGGPSQEWVIRDQV